MSTGTATLAYLHAHGLDVAPEALAEALRAAMQGMEARYRSPAGREGLTEAEAAVARTGGLCLEPGWTKDPLLEGVVALASQIETGLTTGEAAARLGVSDARIRQRLSEHTLLAVLNDRTWCLPLFQFAEGGELPGWRAICRNLPADVSPVAVERWMSIAHPDLVTAARP